MILDASAILAAMFQETPAPKILDALNAAEWIGVGAPTLAETGIVLGRRLGLPHVGVLHRFLQEFEVETLPFDAAHWVEAVSAYERFGRGRHAAQLNVGDCLTYATARIADAPLLCVGSDFARTDLTLVQLT